MVLVPRPSFAFEAKRFPMLEMPLAIFPALHADDWMKDPSHFAAGTDGRSSPPLSTLAVYGIERQMPLGGRGQGEPDVRWSTAVGIVRGLGE